MFENLKGTEFLFTHLNFNQASIGLRWVLLIRSCSSEAGLNCPCWQQIEDVPLSSGLCWSVGGGISWASSRKCCWVLCAKSLQFSSDLVIILSEKGWIVLHHWPGRARHCSLAECLVQNMNCQVYCYESVIVMSYHINQQSDDTGQQII